MAETLLKYQHPVVAASGAVYAARACGSPIPGGTWQVWIEFTPAAGGPPLRTGRETVQPNRICAAYWASGVSHVYLDGALGRALARVTVNMRLPAPEPEGFDLPAVERIAARQGSSGAAVLDPFVVYQHGEPALRRALVTLATRDLVDIAVAYDLTSVDRAVLNHFPAAPLVEMIVLGVRDRTIFAPGPPP